jgi:hypothetical protein
MNASRARRLEVLQRLNAYDSGPHEAERGAARESEHCKELLIEANRWPSTWYLSRIMPGVCGR